MLKVKGKKIYSNGEVIGSIVGHRDVSDPFAGYSVKLIDGRQFAVKPAIIRGEVSEINRGAFAYFDDAAKYVRNGGLESDMAA